MNSRIIQFDQWLPQPIEKVYAFFADAFNLDKITPRWLSFEIITPAPIVMRSGTKIDYRLKWRWLPLRWRTEITVWSPPYRFVDQQIKGPYRRWIHEHTFVEKNGGTQITDRVDYAVPGGPLEPLLHNLFVGQDVCSIFYYRQQKIQDLFGSRFGG